MTTEITSMGNVDSTLLVIILTGTCIHIYIVTSIDISLHYGPNHACKVWQVTCHL